MLETAEIPRSPLPGKEDALLLGSATLEAAGYHRLSRRQSPPAPGQPEPGLVHHMAVSLPLSRIYTHGDLGVLARARRQVGHEDCPPVEALPETMPDNNIEFLHTGPPPDMMVKSPGTVYGVQFPRRLFIASIDQEYDLRAVDSFLFQCRRRRPESEFLLAAGEQLPGELKQRYDIRQLDKTWEELLEEPEFMEYYRQRLERLFKEHPSVPGTAGFINRQMELKELDRACSTKNFIHIKGYPGVGKTALLARGLGENEKNTPVLWVYCDSRFISRAEVIIALAIRLDLLKSPDILEQPNPELQVSRLQTEVERHLAEKPHIVVLDGLDPFFKQGRNPVKNKSFQDLIYRWATDHKLWRRSKLVFTGDLTEDKNSKDPFAREKNALFKAVRSRGRYIWVNELADHHRKELFFSWLKPLEIGTPDLAAKAERLYGVESQNLRLLRLLALWVCAAGGIDPIEEQITQVENAKRWAKEGLLHGFLFKALGAEKQLILKTLEWIGRPVPRAVICSSPGMAGALEQLAAEDLVLFNRATGTVEPVFRFGKEDRGPKAAREEAAPLDREIRSFRRLGEIASPRAGLAAELFTGGAKLCQNTNRWSEWRDAPLPAPTALVPRAKALVREAKQTGLRREEKEALARRAMELCQKSLALHTNEENAHFFLAQAMSFVYPRSNNEEIQSHYQAAVKLAPRRDILSRYAIFTYRRLKDYVSAEKLFLKLQELGGKKTDVLGLHAQADFYLHWSGHEKDAAKILDKIINEGENIQVLFLAARVFTAMGLKALALHFFAQCLAINDKDIQALNEYANACVQWKDEQKARLLFEKSLKVDDKNVPTFNSYANACVQWKDEEKARMLFDKALDIQGDDVKTLNSYANACVQWKDEPKARLLFEKSLKVDDKNVPTLNSYANARVQWGEADKARQLLEKALKLEPQNTYLLETNAKLGKQQEKKTGVTESLLPQPGPAPLTIRDAGTAASPAAVPLPTPEKIEAEPTPSGQPSTPAAPQEPSIPAPFTFDDEEKQWLLLPREPGQTSTWTGSRKWAAFGMLYTLYYLYGQLDAAADLGHIPAMERENRKLLHTVQTLALLNRGAQTSPASASTSPAIYREDPWFQQKGAPRQLTAYYDHQLYQHPQNPVCAAFLCGALAARGWKNTARRFGKDALQWTGDRAQQWAPFITGHKADLFTPAGKTSFLRFLDTLTPGETQPTPITGTSVTNFLDSFSGPRHGLYPSFPWEQLAPAEQQTALFGLYSRVEDLETILQALVDGKEEAPARLTAFLETIAPARKLFKRLAGHAARVEPPPQLPLYVSGGIKEVTAEQVTVTIDPQGDEATRDITVPLKDFPDGRAHVGHRFFGKIPEDEPGRLYDIEVLPYPPSSFDDVFISLFGEEAHRRLKEIPPSPGKE